MNVATRVRCNVCDAPLADPVYRSSGAHSLTSLCEPWPGATVVHACEDCGHVQTEPLADLGAYYDHEYDILVASEDEDQIYRVVDGRPVFRMDHQIATLLAANSVRSGARVLDYGCAKAGTLRKLVAARPDIIPHVFDVSANYQRFWQAFLRPDQCATYVPRPEWSRSFDLVTSFYALEHVGDPRSAMRAIRSLLVDGGRIHAVVPSMFTNTADFVVADHVNHFTERSLARLLASSGFEDIRIDADAHDGAFVVTARAGASSGRPSKSAGVDPRVAPIADYWRELANRVRLFEQQNFAARRVAVYGSGFYGTYLATSLSDTSRVECFLDQNPHRQGQQLLGKPVIAPEALDAGVEVVYVGLNPRVARENIAAIASWSPRRHRYFFP